MLQKFSLLIQGALFRTAADNDAQKEITMQTSVCRWAFSVILAGTLVLTSATARSEFYVAGQAGISLPGSFTNVEGLGSAFGGAGFKSTDLDLANSVLLGAKVGYFFPRLNWLGIEGEYFHTNPHIKQQSATITAPNGATGTLEKQGAHVSMSTGAINVIARYPGKRFQPYVGVGLGMFGASVSSNQVQTLNNQPLSASDFSFGLNALAGVRYFLTKRVALFGEYKYNRASFQFEGNAQFKADYSASNIVGGISLHF